MNSGRGTVNSESAHDPRPTAHASLPSYIEYAAELAAKHTGENRPAWQQLPEHDTGDQASRSDYLAAGFRMTPRQPDVTHK